jgi:integrase
MGKQVAAEKIEISNRSLGTIAPGEKPRIVWDTKLTGFGIKVMPSGTLSFIVNYRAEGGGRKAPNRRMTIGRHGTISVAKARQKAQEILGEAAGGKDPSKVRQEKRAMSTLGDIFDAYMSSNPNRKPRTNELYRYEMERYLGDWQKKPINAITRTDIQERFNTISIEHGPSPANRVMSLLRSVYRAPCAENEALRNPVEVWQAGGGRFNKKPRRKINTPSDILPKWEKGFEAVQNTVIRDAIYVGLYTGMRLREVLWLKWSDIKGCELTVKQTKNGEILQLPITKQLAEVFKRRKKGNETDWVFPNSETKSGHFEDIHHIYPTISKAAETKFWFHALRNNFITIAERDIGLATSLTKRLVNHARPQDVTEGYAADWTSEQLLKAAQAVADRIDDLIGN